MDQNNPVKTYFAPPERSGGDRLERELEAVSANPVMDAILGSVMGLLAILDGNRQVISVNAQLLDSLGLAKGSEVFGLRLGEMVGCDHAAEGPSGCGTTPACASCGAVVAMMASMEKDLPEERLCTIHAGRDGADRNYCLRVRSVPFSMDGMRFLLFFLQDVTDSQYRALLERAFMHDVGNLVGGLEGLLEMNASAAPDDRGASRLLSLARRLSAELSVQKSLMAESRGAFRPSAEELEPADLFADVRELFDGHNLMRDKALTFSSAEGAPTFRSDRALLGRVLSNMVSNALEASPRGGAVRVSARAEAEGIAFEVWNPGAIPDPVRPRIFQKFFSTKEGRGRGVGTHSMKLIGEDVLGGLVGFESGPEAGTTFRIVLPRG